VNFAIISKEEEKIIDSGIGKEKAP